MLQKAAIVSVLVWTALVLACAAGEPVPPAAQWVPGDAILVLEISRPETLLDLGLDQRIAAAVAATPAYKQQAAQPGFLKFRGVLLYFEALLGTDWKTGLHKLLDGGATVAVDAKGGALLAVDAEDPKLLAKLHDVLAGMAKQDPSKKDRVAQSEYRSATVWTFGDGNYHAILGNRLLWANREGVLHAALDLRAQPGGRNLASSGPYQAARRAASPDTAALALVNLAALKQHPPIREALAQGTTDPMASLLFAGVLESLRQSDWLTLDVRVKGDALTLRATTDGKVPTTAEASGFTSPGKPEDGALPNLDVPRRIAAGTLYRDLHGFYAAKDRLFPERTSGLIFFENMMGIFFSGRDLTEEVLAETRPEIRFVVAEQQYDPARGVPQIRLPAFAVVFRLRHPSEFGEVAEEAFQKAIGLVSVTSGQKADPGLIIDRPTHGDVRFTTASYTTSRLKDKSQLGVQYNFRPSLARVGENLVLSSTDGLARDLIDSLKKETAAAIKPQAGIHSMVELEVPQLASTLGTNRAALIQQNMTEKGTTEEQAQTTIDSLLAVLKNLGQVKLSIGSHDGQGEAQLEVRLSLPPAAQKAPAKP